MYGVQPAQGHAHLRVPGELLSMRCCYVCDEDSREQALSETRLAQMQMPNSRTCSWSHAVEYVKINCMRKCGCGDSGHANTSWCSGCGQCVDCCRCDDFTPAQPIGTF